MSNLLIYKLKYFEAWQKCQKTGNPCSASDMRCESCDINTELELIEKEMEENLSFKQFDLIRGKVKTFSKWLYKKDEDFI